LVTFSDERKIGVGIAWLSDWSFFVQVTTAKVNGSVVNGVVPVLTSSKELKVVFVLGGPGSGKGTQCSKIVETFGFVHLSAGDLLRAEIKSGNENGNMIQNMIKEGKIVPAEVTVKLLQKAMEESENDKFLIDGFPRNEENRAIFESVTGIEPQFILFFDCPEEEMERRLLGRNQGRVDDNIETIRKRFKVFVESSIPVVDYYETSGKVNKIDATKSVDEVFDSIRPLFDRFNHVSSNGYEEELTEAIKQHNINGSAVAITN
jgi:UMP-CMP kinase